MKAEGLNNSNQILLIEQELFTGCESSHIIYLSDDYSAMDFLRCGLLRAVAHLALIFSIYNRSDLFPMYDGFTVDAKKLKCIKTLKQHSWKCNSCKEIGICKSCLYFCHRQHQLGKNNLGADKGKPCQCKNCKIF